MPNSRVALLLFFFATPFLYAQEAQFIVTAPSDTFHIGERIPLTASFSAPAEAHIRVQVPQESRRHFGGPSVEVTPTSGWTDPEGNFKGPMAFAGGVPMPVELTPTPRTTTLDLNDYVHFEQPGDYTVVLLTNEQLSPFNTVIKSASLQSAPLTLHIIAASTEWQAATLSHALNELKTLNAHPQQETLQRRNALYATVADLGTDAAYRAMAADLGDERPAFYSNRTGLYSSALTRAPSAHREVILAAMRSIMNATDTSLGMNFVQTWITLHAANA